MIESSQPPFCQTDVVCSTVYENVIFNEDCLVTMNKIGKVVDVIITSPPYNTSRVGSKADPYSFRYDGYKDGLSDDDYIKWTIDVFNGYDKVLKNNGSILYNISYSSENTDLIWKVVYNIIANTNFTTADTIVWKKDCAIPNNVSPNKLTRIVEFVFVFCRKSEISTFEMNKPINSISKKGQTIYDNVFNFIDAKNNDGSNDLNKATFSTEFVRKLIRLYAKENSLIYDSFMGTGTTAEGCVFEKMRYVGSELSEEQCKYAEKRLNIRISQPTLF